MANRVDLPALPTATVLILAGWNAVGLVVMVTAVGPWILLAWTVALVLTGILLVFGRRRLAQPFAARSTPTGNVILPSPPVGPGASTDARPRRSWSGAALAPTALGRINVSAPLAHLSIGEGDAVVRIRPAILALAFGYRPRTLTAIDTEAVVPVTRSLAKGVAIRPKDGPATYFFTSEVSQLLSEFERVGFPVDWRERRVRLWGRAR